MVQTLFEVMMMIQNKYMLPPRFEIWVSFWKGYILTKDRRRPKFKTCTSTGIKKKTNG